MNDHSYNVLEFHQFLELLSDYCQTEPSRDSILSIRPDNPETICFNKQTVNDALIWLRKHRRLPSIFFEHPEDILKRAVPIAAVLSSDDFKVLIDILKAYQQLSTFTKDEDIEKVPALQTFLDDLPDLYDLYDECERVFDREAKVKSNASPHLSQLRKEIKQIEFRLKKRLESILKDRESEDFLQEDQIIIRNHRYVIPVKRELKSKFKGVIHDQSITGQTVFMEPTTNLQDGNELASLKLEERAEIRRILMELTNMVRDEAENIRLIYSKLLEYDCFSAIAKWANDYDSHYCDYDKELRIVNAKHPLLAKQFKQEGKYEQLVPLNLSLKDDTRLLAVTGSNTGGKTVILKTIGLLHLIAKSQIPIPLEPESSLIDFEAIFADIGDEQSINDNLSTFSAHLENLKSILHESQKSKSLVLLDELGTGTDPTEGAALSCAIMQKLVAVDSLSILTTHLANIKHFVHEHDKMENASVLFNEKDLKPEYILHVGVPGASHALSIAQQIGMPKDIIENAHLLINEDQMNLEKLLAQMEQDQYKLTKSLKTAEAARDKALADQKALSDELKTLRKERKKLLNQAQREALSLVDNTEREMKKLLKQSQKGNEQDLVKKVQEKVKSKKNKLARGLQQTESKPEEPIRFEDLTIGQNVWLENLNAHGKITDLTDKKRIKVDVNGLSFELSLKHVGKAKTNEQAKKQVQTKVTKPIRRSSASIELKLIGQRVEEAIYNLDTYLDEAILSGLDQVKIIHGIGTGALKEAVHDHLKHSILVESFRLGVIEKDPGGPGVTWVTLDRK